VSQASTVESHWVREAVERYEGPLMQYAARLLRNDETARDVVQDTFLRLWEADRSTVERHLAPWLFRVCRNRAVDILRKEGRMKALESDDLPAPPPTTRGGESAETRRGLLDLVAELPGRQQEVLRLKFQAGLSYREIATVLDLTVSHVGVLIHNAIKAVRERAAAAELADLPAPSGAGVTGSAS
jgi:RNA polymerase sigma factor (sigma-70 family)